LNQVFVVFFVFFFCFLFPSPSLFSSPSPKMEDPLRELINRSHRAGLCDEAGARAKPESGVRWHMFVSCATEGAPSLRAVGLFQVDEQGLYFVTQGGPGGRRGGEVGSRVAVALMGKNGPPEEEQWRFEGPVELWKGGAEGALQLAPHSLLASMLACHTGGEAAEFRSKLEKKEVDVKQLQDAEIAAYIITPDWAELMTGGPRVNSPGGPVKVAWTRADGKWTGPNKMAPFGKRK
jgi:hypothetical protein